MQKRAVLTAVGQQEEEMDLLPGSSKKSAQKPKKRCDQPMPTIRLHIDLQAPTKEKCMEVNYEELVRNRRSGDKSKDGGDENNEDEDDAVRTARYYEEKYGNKRRSTAWDDYVDKGMGYDETDPFIDNDEAYDELIPSSLTTKYGGFYVNTGQLDFKPAPASDQPDDSCERTGANACPRVPVVKRRKSSNNTSTSSNNVIVKKKKKDHAAACEQKTVAQMIDHKRQNQNRDRVSPDDCFPQPVRRNRPVIDDDGDDVPVGPANTETPSSHTVDDIIECVARGRANGSQSEKPHSQPSAQTEKPSVIRMTGESSKSDGLAMNSLARMVSGTGRTDGERQSSSNGYQHTQQKSRATDLSHHSSRPADATPSPGFKQHPGLIDHQPHKSATPSSSSLLQSRGSVSGFPQTPLSNNSMNHKYPYDRSPASMRTPPSLATDPQTKQSPTSAQIRSSFQSVIKTSVDSKKTSDTPTMDALMEKVISNSLQKYPNSNSSPYSLPSSTSQLPGKNYKTPPAAHQQPKNSFMSAFLEPGARTHTHLDTMILEHLNNDPKGLTAKTKSDSSLSAPDAASHTKVVKVNDQYRIPNLPIGPKLHHNSSSHRPNSVPTPPVTKQSQPSPQQQQQHRVQKNSPPNSLIAAPSSSSISSSSISQPKNSQSKSIHTNRLSPHSRHSPHTPEAMGQFTPVMHSPMPWHPMAGMFPFQTPLLTSPAPGGMGAAGMPASLSRSGMAMAQRSNLSPDPFLSIHSYAAPPGGGKAE